MREVVVKWTDNKAQQSARALPYDVGTCEGQAGAREGKEGEKQQQQRRRRRVCVWGSDQDGAALSRGMLSVLSYGRLVARAVLGGLSQTDGRDYSLITASYGFGKDFRKGILKKGMCYGDDACFIARHRTADVLGKCSPDAGSLCDCVRKHTLGAR